MLSTHQDALEQLRAIADEHGLVIGAVQHDSRDNMSVDVTFDCRTVERIEGGIPLRDFERLRITLDSNYPWQHPTVETPHKRWAGRPHVQVARLLCLYRSPSIEWNPGDGMFGFIDRLISWLERAAADQLDAIGEPVHPPVAYNFGGAGGKFVVSADVPRAVDSPWVGFCILKQLRPGLSEAVEWHGIKDVVARIVNLNTDSSHCYYLAPAVVLRGPIGFEFPTVGWKLITALVDEGVTRDFLIRLIAIAAWTQTYIEQVPGYPGYLPVMVGTPGRGLVGQEPVTHISCWTIPGELAELFDKANDQIRNDGDPELSTEQLATAKDWLLKSSPIWARVYETRPEATERRDSHTPSAWLKDKRVLLLGCGALGAPIAEHLVRAGARAVDLVDNGDVNPGILVRQPYRRDDIGRLKVDMLKNDLRSIGLDAQIDGSSIDAKSFFAAGRPTPDHDLVIDATADASVRHAIETHRKGLSAAYPPLATVIVGHDAQRGLAVLSKRGATGGATDILRKLAIRITTTDAQAMTDVRDDFYPDPPRNDMFQPEPGCSDPTFIGSSTQAAALAGHMLTAILGRLHDDDERPMSVTVVRMRDTARSGARTLSWANDTIVDDDKGRFEVRVSPAALREMRAEARRGARVRGPEIETGGTLLGRFDDAANIAWIDAATGPPPDSQLSSHLFVHGRQGTTELVQAWQKQTRRGVGFIGMWHSHPYGEARPSPTDEQGMASLTTPVLGGPRRAVMLIAGGISGWQPWLDDNAAIDLFVRVVDRNNRLDKITTRARASTHAPNETWWPGGYAMSSPEATTTRRARRLFSARWFGNAR